MSIMVTPDRRNRACTCGGNVGSLHHACGCITIVQNDHKPGCPCGNAARGLERECGQRGIRLFHTSPVHAELAEMPA